MQSVMNLAKNIEHLNEVRQTITAQDMVIVNKIIQKPKYKKANVLVIYDPRLHPQVVGIEASRVIEETNKPTIIIGHLKGEPLGANVNRGSGRSIPEFDLFKAMNPKNVRSDMISFGGHPMACGLSIKTNRIKDLRRDLNYNARNLGHVAPTIKPDIVLQPQNITMNLLNSINQLEPFGQNNEEPLVYLQVPQAFQIQAMGNNNNTLGFRLGNNYQATKCVGFRMGQEWYSKLVKKPYHLELIGTLKKNTWNGQTNVEFLIQHLRHYQTPLTRKELSFLYKGIYRLQLLQPKVSIHNVLMNYHYDLDVDVIKSGLKVFSELHLIIIKNNYIKLTKPSKKVNLKSSKTFRKLS